MTDRNVHAVQGAMDWLEKTQDTPLDELQADEEEARINAAPLADGAVAMSLVCNECGKKFRNQTAAEFHANKTYVPVVLGFILFNPALSFLFQQSEDRTWPLLQVPPLLLLTGVDTYIYI